jgi:hypothetical protein
MRESSREIAGNGRAVNIRLLTRPANARRPERARVDPSACSTSSIPRSQADIKGRD